MRRTEELRWVTQLWLTYSKAVGCHESLTCWCIQPKPDEGSASINTTANSISATIESYILYIHIYLDNCPNQLDCSREWKVSEGGGETYLICGRLIFEETALCCRRIWILVALLPRRLHIINGRSEELVLQQTRIGQAIACCFATISLLLACLWWVIIGLVNGRKARLPIVVGPAERRVVGEQIK